MEAALTPLCHGLAPVDRRLPPHFEPADELLQELHVDVVVLDDEDIDWRHGRVDVRGQAGIERGGSRGGDGFGGGGRCGGFGGVSGRALLGFALLAWAGARDAGGGRVGWRFCRGDCCGGGGRDGGVGGGRRGQWWSGRDVFDVFVGGAGVEARSVGAAADGGCEGGGGRDVLAVG